MQSMSMSDMDLLSDDSGEQSPNERQLVSDVSIESQSSSSTPCIGTNNAEMDVSSTRILNNRAALLPSSGSGISFEHDDQGYQTPFISAKKKTSAPESSKKPKPKYASPPPMQTSKTPMQSSANSSESKLLARVLKTAASVQGERTMLTASIASTTKGQIASQEGPRRGTIGTLSSSITKALKKGLSVLSSKSKRSTKHKSKRRIKPSKVKVVRSPDWYVARYMCLVMSYTLFLIFVGMVFYATFSCSMSWNENVYYCT